MSILKRKVNIIPLGQNCMPRTILTRWKLKPSKFMGEPSYPFDLAVFGIPEITKLLKTDFSEMFYDLEYNGKYWIKAPNCIEFSHDKRFKKNDLYKLITLYADKIENFEIAILDKTPILFVQIPGDCEEVNAQYFQLLRMRQNRPFKFAVIDAENVVKDVKYDDIHVLKIRYPMPDYKENWWKKEYYGCFDGELFEKQIVDFCRKLVNELISSS